MQQLHLLITGRVQCVGFRRFVLRGAERVGVSGWVRNNDDGSVETYVVGNADKLSEFVALCRKGPLFAFVSDVQFLPIDEPTKALFLPDCFRVLR